MKLHRLTPALRRALAVTLSAAMALGLTACQQAQDTAGSTATAPAVETSESQAAAQAQEYGHSLRRETGYLAIHSILHLLGYDHVDEGPMKRQMRAREEKILADIVLPR